MSSVRDKQNLLSKKKHLRGSRFFLNKDLTVKQQEERREEVAKVRETRDEGRIAWLYKGRAVISHFGLYSKSSQKTQSKEMATNSLGGSGATRPIWSNSNEDSTLSLVGQNK